MPYPAANGTGAAASRSYAYDLAGNRTTAGEADLIANTNSTTAYATNGVNAYSNVGGTGFTYDADGNMTRGLARNDGSLNGPLVPMNLTWDAHNRLKTAAPVTAAAGRLRGTYTYDAQGRRIHRLVEVFQGGTWVLQSQVRTSYDGWNMNYEVTVDAASQTTARRLTWGKDLSGSTQGAGGVGGLLMTETSTDGGTTWTPAYHLYDGNGNVSTVLDGTGVVLAAYTYDPYGRVVASSGAQAATNVWRFSTKPVDVETGWSYYGYRYYSPELGRWTARDPIQENGGLNTFALLANSTLVSVDTDGRNGWGPLNYNTNGSPNFGVSSPGGIGCIGAIMDGFDRSSSRFDDKQNHCITSCEMAKACGGPLTFVLGHLKEVRDVIADFLPESWERQGHDMEAAYLDMYANDYGRNVCSTSEEGCEAACLKLYPF